MKFSPKTDKQINESSGFTPWPAGTYDFEITDAVDAISKAGNEMITLTMFVFNSQGERRIIYDYLLESIAQSKNAAKACGLVEQYESGTLEADDFRGKTGRLKLGIQPEKDDYPAKNNVRDYVVQQSASAPRQPAMAGGGRNDLDDEIPF